MTTTIKFGALVLAAFVLTGVAPVDDGAEVKLGGGYGEVDQIVPATVSEPSFARRIHYGGLEGGAIHRFRGAADVLAANATLQYGTGRDAGIEHFATNIGADAPMATAFEGPILVQRDDWRRGRWLFQFDVRYGRQWTYGGIEAGPQLLNFRRPGALGGAYLRPWRPFYLFAESSWAWTARDSFPEKFPLLAAGAAWRGEKIRLRGGYEYATSHGGRGTIEIRAGEKTWLGLTVWGAAQPDVWRFDDGPQWRTIVSVMQTAPPRGGDITAEVEALDYRYETVE